MDLAMKMVGGGAMAGGGMSSTANLLPAAGAALPVAGAAVAAIASMAQQQQQNQQQQAMPMQTYGQQPVMPMQQPPVPYPQPVLQQPVPVAMAVPGVPAPYGAPQYPAQPMAPPIMQQPGYGVPGGQVAPYNNNQYLAVPPAALPCPPGCPPGLQYLTMLDHILVHQQVELLEVFTGFETANQYTVKNTLGQDIFFAKEDSSCCTRWCCDKGRSFGMKIVDHKGEEIIHLERPARCQANYAPCCRQEMEVSSPPGTVIGRIEQLWSLCYPRFAIKNEAGDTVLRISGPCNTMSCCMRDVEFEVLSEQTGEKVGKISKQWSGVLKEAFTDADNFGISFPMDLDVKIKATLLGAVFLIDFMFFEETEND